MDELIAAVLAGDKKRVKKLITSGAEVNARDEGGRTALMLALGRMVELRVEDWQQEGLRNEEAVLFVIRRGVLTVREGERDFVPPLGAQRKIAAQCNPAHESYLACRDNAQALIKAGADVTWADAAGRTALHLAMMVGDPELVNKLLKAGADMTATDGRGRTPVHDAAASGRKDLFDRCKALTKADLESRDGEGLAPVHLAARAGQVDVLQWLVIQGQVSLLIEPRPSALAEKEQARDYLTGQESLQEKRRLVPEAMPLADIMAALRSGERYMPQLGRNKQWRKDLTPVHAILDGRWIAAWLDAKGSVVDMSCAPEADLEAALKKLARGKKVDAVLLPWSLLPPGTPDALLAGSQSQQAKISATVGPAAESEPARLTEDFRAGRGLLVFKEFEQDLGAYATLAGQPVVLNFHAGALAEVRIAGVGPRTEAALAQAERDGKQLTPLPAIPDAQLKLIEAAVAGEVGPLLTAAAAPSLRSAQVRGRSGAGKLWTLKGNSLEGEAVVAEALRQALADGGRVLRIVFP